MMNDIGFYGPLGLLGIAFLYLTGRRPAQKRRPMPPPPPPIGESERLRERLRWVEERHEQDREMLRMAFSDDPGERSAFDRMREEALRDRARQAERTADAELLGALAILGLTREDLREPKRVRRAYAAKVKEVHPDRGGSDDALRAVVSAWEYLSAHI